MNELNNYRSADAKEKGWTMVRMRARSRSRRSRRRRMSAPVAAAEAVTDQAEPAGEKERNSNEKL